MTRHPILPLALCLGIVPAPAVHAKAPAKTSTSSKAKKASKPSRAVSDSTWSAMVDRPLIIISDGRELRGRLAGHDADTVTIIAPDGAITDVQKDSVSEVRADVAPQNDAPPDLPPKRDSESTGTQASTPADVAAPAGSFRRKGTFLLLSPGVLALDLSEPKFPFYRWGFSIGKFLPSEVSRFAGAYGFTFEHFVNHQTFTESYFDPYYGYVEQSGDVWAHLIRGMGEFRLGGSSDRVFGYALLGVGVSILHVAASSGGVKATDSSFGFVTPLGAGIEGLIGERFILGFEPRMVFDFFIGGGINAMFDARLVLGTKF